MSFHTSKHIGWLLLDCRKYPWIYSTVDMLLLWGSPCRRSCASLPSLPWDRCVLWSMESSASWISPWCMMLLVSAVCPYTPWDCQVSLATSSLVGGVIVPMNNPDESEVKLTWEQLGWLEGKTSCFPTCLGTVSMAGAPEPQVALRIFWTPLPPDHNFSHFFF